MAISLDEELLSPAEAARLIPKRRVPSTIWRWYRHGVRGVQLETVVIGGRRYTSREALQRFIRRTTEARQQNDLESTGGRDAQHS